MFICLGFVSCTNSHEQSENEVKKLQKEVKILKIEKEFYLKENLLLKEKIKDLKAGNLKLFRQIEKIVRQNKKRKVEEAKERNKNEEAGNKESGKK